MTNLRGGILSVAVTALLGLVVSGCAGTTTGQGGTPATADPKAALAASTKELINGNFAFAAAMPSGTAKGAVHLPSKSAAFTVETTGQEAMKIELVLADPDRWVRMTMDTKQLESALLTGDDSSPVAKQVKEALKLFTGKTWFHIDATKVKKGGSLDIDLTDPDLTGASGLLRAVSNVHGDAHTISGTLDATKAASADGFLDSDTVSEMGAAAAALPFTASLDDRGRLTKLAIDAPKAGETPAGKWTVTITGYGEQAAQTKPTGAVTEMPASGYQAMNG